MNWGDATMYNANQANIVQQYTVVRLVNAVYLTKSITVKCSHETYSKCTSSACDVRPTHTACFVTLSHYHIEVICSTIIYINKGYHTTT